MLLENVLQEYIYECRLRKLSEKSIKTFLNNNKKFFQYLSNEFQVTELEEIRRIHVQSYISFLSNLGRKESYINSLIKCFRGFFKYCINEDYIKTSPMEKIQYQKEEIPLIKTFNLEEAKKMAGYYSGKKFLDVRNKLIIVLLLDSGIRNNELCNIKVDDIGENAIRIYGKGKKVRYVPLTPSINKALIRYNYTRNVYIQDKFNYQQQYLFLSQKGKKLTVETIERIVKICGEKVNVRTELRCSPHTCRHFYAQTQLMNGCDLFTVSRLLGHNNINITRRYLFSIQTDDTLELAQKTTPLSNL